MPTLDSLYQKALAATPDVSFEDQLAKFLAWSQRLFDTRMAESKFPYMNDYRLEPNDGARYIRIASAQRGWSAEGVPSDKYGENSRSAWAFIDRTNGDILKPDGWKRPAKHARGNIYDEASWAKWITPYGPGYLRR
jgi:hypothetical protein